MPLSSLRGERSPPLFFLFLFSFSFFFLGCSLRPSPPSGESDCREILAASHAHTGSLWADWERPFPVELIGFPDGYRPLGGRLRCLECEVRAQLRRLTEGPFSGLLTLGESRPRSTAIGRSPAQERRLFLAWETSPSRCAPGHHCAYRLAGWAFFHVPGRWWGVPGLGHELAHLLGFRHPDAPLPGNAMQTTREGLRDSLHPETERKLRCLT